MKQNKFILLVYVFFIIGVNVAIFRVSMNEPFNAISYNELKWQVIIPSVLIGAKFVTIPMICIMKNSINLKIYTLIILLILGALELATIYGYSSELGIV